MKLLLDTHTFIWWDSNASRLPPTTLTALRDPANSVVLSAVSVWEMIIKTHLNKLALRLPLSEIIAEQQANGLSMLHVRLDHVLAIETLPSVHKDPFDRMLVAQANVEEARLVSGDKVFGQYPVPLLWS
jgi:PIN domain nuclease of toxin-antitoxin system